MRPATIEGLPFRTIGYSSVPIFAVPLGRITFCWLTALEMSAMVAGHGTALAEPDAGERLDRRALSAYRSRLREIDEELDEAQSWNDPARVNMRESAAVRPVLFSVPTKKPSPAIARSVEDAELWIRPCWLTNWRVMPCTPPAE